jgi:glucose dehydrogenase
MAPRSPTLTALIAAAAGGLLTAYIAAQGNVRQSPAASREFPGYGGGPQQIRYSPLARINKSNVTQLAVAMDVRHRRTRRDADAAGRRRRRPVRLHPDA